MSREGEEAIRLQGMIQATPVSLGNILNMAGG
jgi:hypothetical protein